MAGVSRLPGSRHVPEDFIFIRRSIYELIMAMLERRDSISALVSELADDPTHSVACPPGNQGPFGAMKISRSGSSLVEMLGGGEEPDGNSKKSSSMSTLMHERFLWRRTGVGVSPKTLERSPRERLHAWFNGVGFT